MHVLRNLAGRVAPALLATTLLACSGPSGAASRPTYRGQPATYWLDQAPLLLLGGERDAQDDVLGAVVSLAPQDAEAATLLAAWLADSDLQLVSRLLDLLAWRESIVVPQAVPSLVRLLQVREDEVAVRAAALLVRHDLAASGGEPAFRHALRTLAPGPLDPEALNALAWDLAQDEGGEARQHLLALELALAAVRLDGRRSARMLDTLAWAHWRNGQVGLAVVCEQQALALADETQRPRYEQNLAHFRGAAEP